ncbi:MAG: hopanoid-associated sugar epimerase, partial [Aestuariivirgaceae bacterium]
LNVVHVDDVAEGHLLAWEHGKIGERYILGAENLNLQTILTDIAKLTGVRPPAMKLPVDAIMPIAYVADWAARTFSLGEPFVTVDGLQLARKKMFFSSQRAIDELGYAPRPAAEALSDAVAWFREHGYL